MGPRAGTGVLRECEHLTHAATELSRDPLCRLANVGHYPTARIVFGVVAPREVQDGDFEDHEDKIKNTGAYFRFSGDAVVGPLVAVLCAGPSFEAGDGETVAVKLPEVHAAWRARITQAAAALGFAIGGPVEPGWLLLATAG